MSATLLLELSYLGSAENFSSGDANLEVLMFFRPVGDWLVSKIIVGLYSTLLFISDFKTNNDPVSICLDLSLLF